MKYVSYGQYLDFIDSLSPYVFLDVQISEDGDTQTVIIDSGFRKGCVVARIEDFKSSRTYLINDEFLK